MEATESDVMEVTESNTDAAQNDEVMQTENAETAEQNTDASANETGDASANETGAKDSEVGGEGQEKVADGDTDDVVVVSQTDPSQDVIVIEDDEDVKAAKQKMEDVKDAKSFWRLQVCPILFHVFAKNRQCFQDVMSKGLSFEFRMSQDLLSKRIGEKAKESGNFEGPWIPAENIFAKQAKAATVGMVEMKLVEDSVPEVVDLICNCDNERNDRIRFELLKISKEEALASPFKQEGEVVEKAKEEKEGENTDEEMKENIVQVNFAKRCRELQDRGIALKHPEGHVKTEEDDYIFIKNIPDDIPDTILKAIMNMEMIERKLGDNSTGSATFKVTGKLSAQEYMELYEGILVNAVMLEVSTTLGSLADVKKARQVQQGLPNPPRSSVGPKSDAGTKRKLSDGGNTPDKRAKESNTNGQKRKRPSRFSNLRPARGGYSNTQRQPLGSSGPRAPPQRPGRNQGAAFRPNRGPARNMGAQPGLLGNVPAYPPGVNVEAEAEAQLQMMAEIQARMLEKQRELSLLQNQARLQMAMLEEQEMAAAAMHHQQHLQQQHFVQRGPNQNQPKSRTRPQRRRRN